MSGLSSAPSSNDFLASFGAEINLNEDLQQSGFIYVNKETKIFILFDFSINYFFLQIDYNNEVISRYDINDIFHAEIKLDRYIYINFISRNITIKIDTKQTPYIQTLETNELKAL